MKNIFYLIIVCIFAMGAIAAEYKAVTADNTVDHIDKVMVEKTDTIESKETTSIESLKVKREIRLNKIAILQFQISILQEEVAVIDSEIIAITPEASKVILKKN